jgi:hypothetical protein
MKGHEQQVLIQQYLDYYERKPTSEEDEQRIIASMASIWNKLSDGSQRSLLNMIKYRRKHEEIKGDISPRKRI